MTDDPYRLVCSDESPRYAPTEQAAIELRFDAEGACDRRHMIEVRQPDGTWLAVTLDRARRIMACRPGQQVDFLVDGPLILNTVGWLSDTRKRPAIEAALAADDQAAYLAALGPCDVATLTADGRAVKSDGWCRCRPQPDMQAWVRYERWTLAGREGHGYVCRACRRITQTG